MKGKQVVTLKKRKSLTGYENVLQNFSAKNFEFGFQLLTLSGQHNESTGNGEGHHVENNTEMNTDKELPNRPLSDEGPVTEAVNLPKLDQRNKTLDDSARNRDTGTIKRPFEGNRVLPPLVIQAFSRNKPDKEVVTKLQQTVPTNLRLDDAYLDTKSESTEYMQNIKDGAISPFPPVEEQEIDKHRHLNEEAERNSNSKAPPYRYQGFLKRLRLERKPLNEQKPKEVKLTKKKSLKRTQTKPRFMKDFKDEFFDEKPPTPPKPKEIEAKPVKLILGFRYSYALEQYYKGQMTNYSHELKLSSDEYDSSSEEVLNGWLVKSLGPNVLNLRARTLPSCNPIELRLRRQQARLRDLSRSRDLNRSWTRESGLSRALLRSRDSVSKLHTIDEDRESRQSLKEKKVVISHKVEVMGTGQQTDRTNMTVLPPIYSPDKICLGVPKIKRAISLKLPAIDAEE